MDRYISNMMKVLIICYESLYIFIVPQMYYARVTNVLHARHECDACVSRT